jgi:hypothetical protein
MGLQEFIAKYTGKFVEYHSYGTGALYQCVDLINQYITEYLKLPAIIGTNAQDFPSKASKTDYDYILNTPTGVPEPGDIVIFKSADGVGHISIFVEGNANLFTSFDQNYPTGSPCKLVSHNYRNVLGWLHPKKDPMSDTMLIEKKDFDKLMANSLDRDSLCEYLGYPKDTSLETLKNAIAGIKSRASDMERQLASANAEVANRKEQVSRLEADIANWKNLLKTSEDKLNSATSQYKKLTEEWKGQLEAKQTELDGLAKKLGEANIALAECQSKRDYFSVIKFGDLELIKWK